ncbi:MAG: hypothetical protein ACE5OZ_02950 [Candidatus Heimdallarchaeota archaeon]
MNEGILWQGIHVCVESRCSDCGSEIIEDLKIGTAIYAPFQADLRKGLLFGDSEYETWFGIPLLKSLQHPQKEAKVKFEVEKFREAREVIILNCIDFLYGHSLLKLLNAEHHLKEHSNFGLVVIIPSFLRWMVPEGVAEIWSVDISLSKAKNYSPDLDRQIKRECERFSAVYVSSAYLLPKNFDISKFTRIAKHDFSAEDFRITFVWREDRLWWPHNRSLGLIRKLKLNGIILRQQNAKIRRLFSLLRHDFPKAKFTIVGVGKKTRFSAWIEDKRVNRYTNELEKLVCQTYSESRLIIGVHGSNMLLPSGHAGMTIDLMPVVRWGNFAQDILYQEEDNRMSSYKYRFLPVSTTPKLLAVIASTQLKDYEKYRNHVVPIPTNL